MQAIAVAQVYEGSSNRMTILNCADPRMKARIYLNNQHVYDREIYLIEFEPQDQFCHIVPLQK